MVPLLRTSELEALGVHPHRDIYLVNILFRVYLTNWYLLLVDSTHYSLANLQCYAANNVSSTTKSSVASTISSETSLIIGCKVVHSSETPQVCCVALSPLSAPTMIKLSWFFFVGVIGSGMSACQYKFTPGSVWLSSSTQRCKACDIWWLHAHWLKTTENCSSHVHSLRRIRAAWSLHQSFGCRDKPSRWQEKYPWYPRSSC